MAIQEAMLFDKPGEQNTLACIQMVMKNIHDQKIRHVVVASTTGKTGKAFYDSIQKDANLVIVTHSVGFKEPNADEFDQSIRNQLIEAGVNIHTGTILTHSLEKSIMEKFGGSYPGYIIASTLRRFGEGSKVAIEIVMEACDAGLIPEDEEVLAVGGTGWGSDTVLLIKAKPSKRFLDLEVLEILARPRGR